MVTIGLSVSVFRSVFQLVIAFCRFDPLLVVRKRCDANAAIEIAFARLVSARTAAIKAASTPPPAAAAAPASTDKKPPSTASDQKTASVTAAAHTRLDFARPPPKPAFDEKGRPSAAGRAAAAEALLAALGSSSSDGKQPPVAATASIVRCAQAFQFMASKGTFFSEFAFFLRFYVSSNEKITVSNTLRSLCCFACLTCIRDFYCRAVYSLRVVRYSFPYASLSRSGADIGCL